MMPDDLMEVNIADVSITNVGFALFFKPVGSTSPKVVPIFIGPLETYSISSALDGITPPRPNTHDLMINIFKQMEARLLNVVINDIIGNIFYARIVIQHEDRILEIDARPSDSVALAIRSGCPIFMHEKVYRDAAVIIGEEGEAAETGEKPIISDENQVEDRTDLERLQEQLQRALENENYEDAARIRDRIRDFKQEN